jgi:hypothetical protein
VKSHIQQQITPTADFVINKSLLDNGVRREPGEALPTDSVLRTMPRRLKQLCEQRFLVPGKPAVAERAEKQARPAPKPKPKEDLDRLALRELRERCLDNGLSIQGNRDALLKRLRARLG